MALNASSRLMPKDHSVRHKSARLAFSCSKSIKANPFVLPVGSCKTRGSFVNLDWGDIALAE
jgi:hypothetical protein